MVLKKSKNEQADPKKSKKTNVIMNRFISQGKSYSKSSKKQISYERLCKLTAKSLTTLLLDRASPILLQATLQTS